MASRVPGVWFSSTCRYGKLILLVVTRPTHPRLKHIAHFTASAIFLANDKSVPLTRASHLRSFYNPGRFAPPATTKFRVSELVWRCAISTVKPLHLRVGKLANNQRGTRHASTASDPTYCYFGNNQHRPSRNVEAAGSSQAYQPLPEERPSP